MSRAVFVHQLPDEIAPGELTGSIAVIIDVLRASTTIVHALAAGAEYVVPFAGVESARRFAAARPSGTVVLGGERRGVLIEGFHLGNSPESYTPQSVGGRVLVFSTTNGTRALHRALEADRIVIGSFVNLGALVDVLSKETRPIHLVCAGTDGRVTSEDILCAGTIVAELRDRSADITLQGAATEAALRLYETSGGSAERVLASLRASDGGRNLIELDYDADIVRCAQRDLFRIVPEFDPATGRIVG